MAKVAEATVVAVVPLEPFDGTEAVVLVADRHPENTAAVAAPGRTAVGTEVSLADTDPTIGTEHLAVPATVAVAAVVVGVEEVGGALGIGAVVVGDDGVRFGGGEGACLADC